jgi:gamma-glutamylcyclotransferase (GGCT)/AIG2-like uncharacterized protein YtfP
MRGARRTIFVYGSLLRGEANHEQIAGATFLGEARTEAAFDLIDLSEYPAMVRGGRIKVEGELYGVPPALLLSLDAFEGHPRLYRRSRIRLDGGRRVEAYLLAVMPQGARPRIPSGRWRDWLALRTTSL